MKFFLSILMVLAATVTSFAQGQGKITRYFSTVSDLLASNPNDANRAVWLLGLNSVSDGLGGLWFWFPNSVEATNTTTIFQANSTATGRWEKINIPGTAVVDTSGFITNFTVVTVRDVPTLKTVDVTAGIQAVLVRGYYNPNDKGEGTFVYDATSTDIEDGGRFIAPNNGGGMWIRVATPETVYATWYGPTPTNGSIKIGLAYAATAMKGTFILPGIDIYLDGTDPIDIPSRVTVMGQTGTRTITADSPATSYVQWRLSGVEAAGIQNLIAVGWNNPPGGDVNNTGNAITMENCTNCLVGGIIYQDFYSTPLADLGGVIGNGNKFFGPLWEPNSIEAYGADRTGTRDSTEAVKFALDNTGGPQSVIGGRILWPAGIWAGNFVVTNKNIIIDGESFGVDNSITNNKIVPWDPTAFAMTVGADFAGTSLSGSQQGIMLSHLRFDANGPNGLGVGGLHVKSGTYHAHVTDCSFFDGSDAAMLVDCGSNRENFYALFARCQFQCGDGLVTNNAVRFASGISITTLAEFSSCEIHGANAGGHALTVDSGLLQASGNTRVQCANNHGVKIQKVGAPASNPKLYGNWNIDSDFSTDVLVELPDDGPPVNYFVGNVDIDGRIKAGTSGITYIMKNSVLSVAEYIPDALLTSASIYNNLYFQDQNSITNVGPTNSAYITGFNGALQTVNNRGGIYVEPKTYFYLYPTNGIPTMLFQGQGQYSVTLTITFTNLPVENDKITNNGAVWTWGGGATFTGSNIPTNATVAGSAANLLTQFQGTGLTGTWSYDSPSALVVRATRWYYSLTNGVSAGWCTTSLVTNTTANDVFSSSIAVPDSTNMAIQAANILYINSTNGGRAITVYPDAVNGGMTLNSNGVGFATVPNSPAKITVSGRASLGVQPEITGYKAYTNTTSTTQTQLELFTDLRPASPSTTVSHTIYAAMRVPSDITTTVSSVSFPIRSEWTHSGTNVVSRAGGFYTGQPVTNNNGRITSYVGYDSEVNASVSDTWYAFLGNGTAPSRFNGNVGIGKVPTVPLDVVGAINLTGTLAAGDTVTAVNDVFADSHIYSKVGSSSAYASAPGTIDVTATTIVTAGTGSDEAFVTKTLSANSLAASGDRVKMRASGTFAANANNKQIKLTFGSATIFDTTALAMNGGSWVAEAEVIRTGAATEIYNVTWIAGNSTLPVTASVGNSTVGLTTNITLRVLGNAAASDITFKTLTDEYAKF